MSVQVSAPFFDSKTWPWPALGIHRRENAPNVA
jgi:hypothetical protein